MAVVKRFYTIANSVECPVRGWIGHRRETKWFFPLKGATTVTVEPMAGEPQRTQRAQRCGWCKDLTCDERVAHEKGAADVRSFA